MLWGRVPTSLGAPFAGSVFIFYNPSGQINNGRASIMGDARRLSCKGGRMNREWPGLALDAELEQAIGALSPREAFVACCRAGVLVFQVVRSSGDAIFYPRLVAPRSGAKDLAWRRSAGMGTIYSMTKLWRGRTAVCSIVLVDMAEGFRLLSRLIAEPMAPTIGDAVTLEFAEPGEEERKGGIDAPYPVFRLARAEVQI